MNFSEAVGALKAAGVSVRNAEARAVLTAETFGTDGKWRYQLWAAQRMPLPRLEVPPKKFLEFNNVALCSAPRV